MYKQPKLHRCVITYRDRAHAALVSDTQFRLPDHNKIAVSNSDVARRSSPPSYIYSILV
jgi:hypothetical protein